MFLNITIGLLGVIALIAALELVSAAVDDASSWIGERIGTLVLRGVTLGRYPPRPSSGASRLVAGVVGSVILVIIAVGLLYFIARVTSPVSTQGSQLMASRSANREAMGSSGVTSHLADRSR